MIRLLSVLVLISSMLSAAPAQSTVNIGEPCPPITITDWVSNVPQDKNLDNKVIVIDFWATWCGPCIKAVPHYNELVAEFQEEDQIIFLSMTYERVPKIERTLERIDFRSAVVTDQNNQTQESFGIEGLPYTLVIDVKGKLAWKGHPESLSAAIIRDVLDQKSVKLESAATSSESVDLGGTNIGLEAFAAALKDSTVARLFKLIPKVEKKGLNVQKLPQLYYQAGAGIIKTLSDFLDIPEPRISLPEHLKTDYFNIVYIDKEAENKEAAVNFILSEIAKDYNISINKASQNVEVLSIGVADESLLKAAGAGQGSISDAGDKLILSGQPIDKALFELENRMAYPLLNRTELSGNYDFIIETGSLKKMTESLESYGLTVEKTKSEVQFIEVTTQNK